MELTGQSGRHGVGSAHPQPNAGEVALAGSGLEHHPVHRRDPDEDRRTPTFDRVEHIVGAEPAEHEHRNPRSHRGEEPGESHHVGQRKGDDRFVASKSGRDQREAAGRRKQTAMRESGALRLAGGARRVQEHRNVARIHLDVEVHCRGALPGRDDRWVREGERGARITPHVLCFGGRRSVVQRNGDATRPADREAPEDQFRAVGKLDQHPIALGDARANELGGVVNRPGDLVRRPTKTIGSRDQGLCLVRLADAVGEGSERERIVGERHRDAGS